MVHQGRRVPDGTRGAPRLTATDLIDADWYIAQYQDLTTDDPCRHYLTEGWRQGRDPGPLFDTDWFLASYPAARVAEVNPLDYFLEWGSRLLLRPNPLFDPRWYAAAHPRANGSDPFTHYIREGQALGLGPSPVIATMPEQQVDDAGLPHGRVVVVVQAGNDFVHADRCLRALDGIRGWERAVVGIDAGHADRWRRWESHPRVRIVRDGDPGWGRHVPAGTDYILLLRADTEPRPGLLSSLIERHREAAPSIDGTLVVCPKVRPTLVAPEIRSDWWRLTELSLPPQAALVSHNDWRALMGRSPGTDDVPAITDLLRRTLENAGSVWTDENSSILSHLPVTLTRQVQQAVPSWAPADTPGLVLLTAAADHPAATAALQAWLSVAACNISAATDALRSWRRELAEMPPDTRVRLPRLVRLRHQLVDEIIQECLLEPGVTQAAARAIADDDRDAAVRALTGYPGSYPAAVAVVALSPRRRPGETPDIPQVIVQGWFDSPLPDDAGDLAATWATQHPGWEHLLFDTDSAAAWIGDHLGPVAEHTFHSATPVGKSNLFRYAYLSVAGGVWSDIDDRCRRRITPLLAGHSLVVTTESTGAVADNVIAVAPGHPALVATREEAFRNVADGFEESPWLANGPGLFTRTVAAWLTGLLAGEATGYRLVSGGEMSEYVAMHEHLAYKETDLAWDVPAVPVEVETGWGAALSPRQRVLLTRNAAAGPTP